MMIWERTGVLRLAGCCLLQVRLDGEIALDHGLSAFFP